MHRLMMTSEAYRMASSFEHEANTDADPENNLLWRLPPAAHRSGDPARRHHDGQRRNRPDRGRDRRYSRTFRPTSCSSRTARDSGAAVRRRDGGFTAPSTGIWCEEPDRPEVWRRSVYVFRRRSLGFPFFDTFDLPDQNQTAAARNVSTVSTQALTLMNNPFVLNQAELFAARLETEAPGDLDRQIDLAYLIALTRKPSDMEREIARGLATEQSLIDFTHVMLNLNEFLYLR